VRATVDTNIWVASLLSRVGAPAQVRRAYRDGRFTLVTSEPLLTELEGVLARPQFVRKYGITSAESAELVAVPGAIRVCRDPNDDVVIETAVLGHVDILVSGDADLKSDPNVVAFLAERGTVVLSVREFLQRLDDETSQRV
jgi:putative PIN family toxin of toxin-antitoxin system